MFVGVLYDFREVAGTCVSTFNVQTSRGKDCGCSKPNAKFGMKIHSGFDADVAGFNLSLTTRS